MKGKISIIVPVYNVENYLEKCLDSLISQTYSDIEIVCINDGSKDRSSKILKNYSLKDNRIRVINKENNGLSEARNTGLKEISGEYVMFVDSDDWIDENTCQIAIDTITEHQSDIVMWSYISEHESSGSPKKIFEADCVFEGADVLTKLHRRFIGLVGEELAHPELADSISTIWGKLYKKSLIDNSKASFIDLSEIGTYEDGMFNLEVFFYANKVNYLNKCLYHYRRNNVSSTTSIYRENLYKQWKILHEKMYEYIKNKGLSDFYYTALNNRRALSLLGLGLNITGSNKNIFEKNKLIKEILMNPQYREAYKELDFSYFPVHWKFFYVCAKFNFSYGVYLLLLVIRKIIYR